jgi:hypothetical protein
LWPSTLPRLRLAILKTLVSIHLFYLQCERLLTKNADSGSYGGAVDTYDGGYLPPLLTVPADGTETTGPEESLTTDIGEEITPPVIDDPTITTPGGEVIITIPIEETPVPTPDTGDTVTVPADGEFTPEPTPEETPDFTPEPTPDETPDFTPEPTPEATPEPVPEPIPQLACGLDVEQCYNTMEIYCDLVVAGISRIPGSLTAQECFERCSTDPGCVLFTHAGTDCFLAYDPARNQGEFSLQGWTSGVKGRC